MLTWVRALTLGHKACTWIYSTVLITFDPIQSDNINQITTITGPFCIVIYGKLNFQNVNTMGGW